MTYHPAKYSGPLLPIFARLLAPYPAVLDPMAGSGKIGQIRQYGYAGKIIANDLEEEWADPTYRIDEWHHCDAAALTFLANNQIPAVCTSPTYGNRMADHHTARDGSRRYTYTHCLGHPLHPANTGALQWGDAYRTKHLAIYREIYRVLAPAGIFLLNISNHIRRGLEVPVIEWTQDATQSVGFRLTECISVPTRRLRHGQNQGTRVAGEAVLVLRKGGRE